MKSLFKLTVFIKTILLFQFLISIDKHSCSQLESELDLDMKLDNIINENKPNILSLNQISNDNISKYIALEPDITDSIKDLLTNENKINNNITQVDSVNNNIKNFNNFINRDSYNNNIYTNSNNYYSPIYNQLSSFQMSGFKSDSNNYSNLNSNYPNTYNLNNNLNNFNNLLNLNQSGYKNEIVKTNTSIPNDYSNRANKDAVFKSLSNNPIKSKKKSSKEIDNIKNLFEKKINKINAKNYFSKSEIAEDNAIFKHIYLGSNSPLEKSWKYDLEKNKFIAPNEVLNEDDWNKFLRVLSLLDSMDFNENSEKNSNDKNNNIIINPPIIDYLEDKERINFDDRKTANNKEVLKDDMSFLSVSSHEFKDSDNSDNKNRNYNDHNNSNKKRAGFKSIKNPPNFIIDI